MSLQGDELVKDDFRKRGNLTYGDGSCKCSIFRNGKEGVEKKKKSSNVPDDFDILVNIGPALDGVGRDEDELLAD